jgi:hypothetical protein
MCNARKWKVKDKVEWGSESHAASSSLGHKTVQQSLNYVCVCVCVCVLCYC